MGRHLISDQNYLVYSTETESNLTANTNMSQLKRPHEPPLLPCTKDTLHAEAIYPHLVAVAIKGGLELVEVVLGETSVFQGVRACSQSVTAYIAQAVEDTYLEE